ncbi:tannase/feruloyl esterase family alpha/beta hydrolase [Piscinibacter sakaiensis]|uniref:tannase/feruloyl esterase family alpha/beta hydrolase n=1 Tax=Piscinibacter sakaiensis TaxID=1547922 RepID=UPI003726F4B0
MPHALPPPDPLPGPSEDPARAAPPPARGLAGAAIGRAQIGLPTQGASVTRAVLVPAAGQTPAHCELQGRIYPVDPAAPPIRFQLNLPSPWNEKALHFGGGGFDGSVVSGKGNVPHAWPGSPTPLQRGYATFGSDGGHEGQDPDASFALNDEALRNFTGEALKKVRDVAQQLMLRHYGRGPRLTYFAGGSSGGREAMAVAQRWPDDYEGIIANYPALEFMGLILRANAMAQALYAPGGFPSWGKLDHLNRRVLAACDRQDGLEDGLINAVEACRFDPAVLRCRYNLDLGDSCLTDAQLRVVRALADEMPLAYPLAQGLRSAPPFGILAGANFAGPVDLGVLPVLLDPPVLGLNGYIVSMQSEYLKHFIARDPTYKPLGFDPVGGAPFQARVQQVSALHDATSIDLARFVRRGGKILMMHGTSDTIVPYSVSVRYVTRLRQAWGEAAVQGFLRFYGVAGMGHGEGRYTMAWKSLDLLEDWVERGQPPQAPESRNVLDPFGQSRPLCEHPTWPRYVGGNVRAASSFRCVAP